jgi:hypothetical protein
MSIRSGMKIIIPENKLKLSVKHNKDRPRSYRSDEWSEDLRSVRQQKGSAKKSLETWWAGWDLNP